MKNLFNQKMYMDDYLIPTLNDSRSEWSERLIHILVSPIHEGIKSIFNEAMKMCVENNEVVKYLMTFQNILSKIPNWNSVIIQEEVERIIHKSGCNYISDLIACVHIIQLKVLTCVRVGNKQKKIDISIPKLDHFIHTVYIHVARKLYANVYLFEKGTHISPLQTQKNNRDVENIIRECIMIAIRDSIPTEQIVRSYLDESVEHEEEIIIEDIAEPKMIAPPMDETATPNITPPLSEPQFVAPTISNIDSTEPTTTTTITKETIKFNDTDYVMDENGVEKKEHSPKTIERLEEISMSNSIKRKLEEEEENEETDNSDKIKIHEENVSLGNLDVFNINELSKTDNIPLLSLDVEELF
jgi:hypothetical protein